VHVVGTHLMIHHHVRAGRFQPSPRKTGESTMTANIQPSPKEPKPKLKLSDQLTKPDIPLFKLGQVVGTPGAIDLLRSLALSPLLFLGRHAYGDWGQIDDEDREANRQALKYGNRILSSYNLNRSERLWIITEADRSSTTLLLPQEY
jgi:hypothetical protein